MFKFLKAARNLVNQGMSKEAIEQFARNEFGEINELFQKQIDNLFKPKQGIENIKIKDEVFDDTIVKLPIDDTGAPFNPKDPMKQYGKPKISIEERMDTIKETSKKLDDIMKERKETFKPKKNPDDPEKFYTGGMVDVEPSLSDIGHGSDALMARTRLVSPNSQATTSTGLNYLLAEDNDNIRVPFGSGKTVYDRNSFDHKINELKAAFKHYKRGSATGGRQGVMTFEQFAPLYAKENFAEGGRIGFSKGKLADAARRKFMKTAGGIGAGIAALKTGLIGLGEKAAPVVETAVEAAKGVPPYFFQLVDVIKSKGREIKSYGDRVKQYVAPSKDGKSELMLTEDLSTGDVQVKKIYKENDEMVTKSEEMNFTKGRGDESTKGTPADDYEEVTEFNSRIYKDEFNDPDVVEGIDVDEIVKEIDVKKAEGGRIGYSKGKAVLSLAELLKNPKKVREAIDNIFKTGDYKYDAELAAESFVELNPQAFGNKLYDDLDDKTRLQVYGAVIDDVMGDVGKKIKEKKTGTYKFLKKVFGDSLEDMPDRDPEMYQGLKEVVPMFRKKDKEGLKMYMQKYLPHMDDTEIEEFIVGSGDTAGIRGQLIRLGSGRDYAGKLEMIKKADNMRKLDSLDVTEEMIRKPNATGGIQTMLGE
jgi:hypothetical protein